MHIKSALRDARGCDHFIYRHLIKGARRVKRRAPPPIIQRACARYGRVPIWARRARSIRAILFPLLMITSQLTI